MGIKPGPERTDEALVKECIEGAIEAFGVLVKRHESLVYSVALRALRDTALAEDLAQDVFLRAYRALKGFKPDHRFRPWLMAITANRIRDHIKARSKRGEITWNVDATTPCARSTPLERVAARQMLARVEAGISEMPEDIQEVLRLRFVLGLDYDDVAMALNLPLGTVKSRISRARSSLREILDGVL